jgi:type IV secretory pathway VirB10-like protein
MRAGIVAVFVFAAVLAVGHYVAAPFFCRGGIAIPTLDPRALCSVDFHLSRSGSVLLYFMAIGIAFFFGLIAAMLTGRTKAPEGKAEAKPVETFEQIVAAEEKKAEPAPTPQPAAAPAATPVVEAKSAAAPEEKKQDESAAAPAQKPEAATNEPEKIDEPVMNAVSEAITVGLAANKNGQRKIFDGTNEELLERFRELKKQEGVNSIAQAQRLLDESTMSALAKGIDPKQHLSQIAHLVLTEDPDLKSGVVRGVVVHVAARLKELGVAKQSMPDATKGAA